MRDGDKNFIYFHQKAKQMKKRNLIVGIEDEEERWCADQRDIEKVVSYFGSLFDRGTTINVARVLCSVTPKVDRDMNEDLNRRTLR